MDNIHCAHPDRVQQKIERLKHDGIAKLHLVADFRKIPRSLGRLG